MGSSASAHPGQAGHARLRAGLSLLLDIAVCAAVIRLVSPGILRDVCGGAFWTDDLAQGLRLIVILMMVRVLVEVRPWIWSRQSSAMLNVYWPNLCLPAPGPIFAGAAGCGGAALGLVAAWCVLHPVTDYAPPSVLIPSALLAGIGMGCGVGALAIGLGRVLPRIGLMTSHGAASRLALLLGAGVGVLTAEFDPTLDWAYSTDYPPSLGVVAGVTLFLCFVSFVWVLAAGTRGQRIFVALLAGVLAIGMFWTLPGPLPGGDPVENQPHAVLFITIDTLRADHLGCYGYERETSPALDDLADESVLFERAYAVMPTTDPSHVAMLTGRYPRSTGVMANALPMCRSPHWSLAEWFRDRDYRTGAITSRAHLNPDSMRLPGFQTYSAPTARKRTSEAAEALRRARSWLDRHGDRRFFLWVHFWDPHAPYDPPREPERSMFVDRDYDGPIERRGHASGTTEGALYPPELMRYAIGLYDGEIRYADDHVGQLIREFRKRLGRENVLVIVAADHGETLDEMDASHGYALDHGDFLARQELHVPLMMSWPGHLPEGRRISPPVSSASIAPTVADLLGGSLDGDVPSLLPLIAGASDAGGPVFSERRVFFDPPRECLSVPEFGVINGKHLYVENSKRGRILHDILDDLRGERNLAGDDVELDRRLSDLIRGFKLAFPAAPLDPDAVSEGAAQTMQGLGYAR